MDSVRLALTLVEQIAADGPQGVSALARRLSEPKSTVQRSLETLHDAGWLAAVPDPADGRKRGWTLTSKFAGLRQQVGQARVRDAALGQMEPLRQVTLETIHLMTPEGAEMVLIERLDSPRPLRIVRPLGSRCPLHASSNGKAVLAFLPEPEREAYLARPLTPLTANTQTDPDALRSELTEIRRLGYAVNRGELDLEVRAVAAPIFNRSRRPVGSLSISCPASRLSEEQVAAYGPMVAAAGRAVSEALI
jgi:DNA-binding IclR family transcriptional regulator